MTHDVMAQAPPGMPDYNVEKHCKSQSSIMGGGNFWMKSCLDQEQEAYDVLNREWSSLDPETMRHCRQQASVMGQSYFWLNLCLHQEIEATESLKNYKFKK